MTNYRSMQLMGAQWRLLVLFSHLGLMPPLYQVVRMRKIFYVP